MAIGMAVRRGLATALRAHRSSASDLAAPAPPPDPVVVPRPAGPTTARPVVASAPAPAPPPAALGDALLGPGLGHAALSAALWGVPA